VDPNNPKTLIVETHPIDYKRKITVYVPAQYKAGTDAPFQVIHDGHGGKPNPELLRVSDNLIARKRIPPVVVIWVANGGGDAQGHERGKEYDTMNGDYAEYIETEVLPRVEKNAGGGGAPTTWTLCYIPNKGRAPTDVVRESNCPSDQKSIWHRTAK
jgi:enterochelin esterase-like enzyme